MKTRSLLLVLSLGLAAGRAASGAVETYTIDPVHSSVAFSVRHLFNRVPGNFTRFQGTIWLDRAHPEKSSVVATIDVASLDTRNETRDGHMKAPEYFDVAHFPQITFKSSAWHATGENTYDVTGNLAMKGIVRPIVLKVTLLGIGPGMGGHQVSGWDISAALNRKDFGVTGAPMLGSVLGDDVAISISVEADLKP
jgi:polyisoprenoid-binding protein YceI